MRYQLGLFLAGCLVAISSHAAVPVVLKVTERSFQVEAGGGAERASNPDAATIDNKDPKIPTDLMAQIWAEDRPEMTTQKQFQAQAALLSRNAAAIQEKYGKRLADYIQALAVKHNATIKENDGVKIIVIEDGVSFFRDYYKFEANKDYTFQMIAKALLRNPNRLNNAGALEKLVVNIHEDVRAKTYLLPAKEYTAEDVEALRSLGRGTGYRFQKMGNTYVFGSGMSFLLTRQLMTQGQGENEAKLRKDFEKILRYHEAFQIPVIHGYHQGAMAYYNPAEKEMSFVLPTAADLNTYTHEMTHSRFDKFTETLTSWVQAKGYVVPFHINGPNEGLFTLLNELNSFRMGNQYDRHDTSDEAILKFIKASYGLQAGFEATEMLDKVWTPEKVANKSVAYLIYSEIRDFNKLTNEQLIEMGRNGIETKGMLNKMNFILMFEAGRFDGTALEAQAKEVFQKIGEVENEKFVAKYYENVAKQKGLKISEEIRQTTGSVLDLQKASFNQVFKNFNEHASIESVKILTAKFKDQLKPHHMGAVVKKAMDPMNQQRPDIYLLAEMLDVNKAGYPVAYENGFATVKAFRNTPMLTAFDAAMEKLFFDGSAPTKRLALLNFVTVAFSPEEMPKTFAKLEATAFADPKSFEQLPTAERSKALMDQHLARYVFSPGDGHMGRSARWADTMIKRAKGKPLDGNLVYQVLSFYKESLAAYLGPDFKYGEFAFINMDADTRERAIQQIKALPQDQKETLERASDHMWRWSHINNGNIQTQAVYAMLSNPMFLITNEPKMVEALKGQSASLPLVEFFLNAAEGMLPEAKAAAIAHNEALIKTKTLSGYRIQFKPVKSPYGIGFIQNGNGTRVAMSCNKVLLAK
jgi:hypothetical protein